MHIPKLFRQLNSRDRRKDKLTFQRQRERQGDEYQYSRNVSPVSLDFKSALDASSVVAHVRDSSINVTIHMSHSISIDLGRIRDEL
jgi:hypothetical protein